MRECNKCGKQKTNKKFKHNDKKTCLKCEFRWKTSFLRLLVQDKRLSAKERIAQRLGYMGTGFIMVAPYVLSTGTAGPVIYIIGGLMSIPQVFLAKQWNLVAVNINVMIGYSLYLINS